MAILIVDNYDSFTFNLYQLLQAHTEQEVIVQRNDKLTLAEICALAPAGIVLSPGPGHPGNRQDFGVCGEILAEQAKLNCPVLGVCLGHQGIAHHLGGKVVRAPQIVHGKTSTIKISGQSKLLDGLPAAFTAMRYHSLVVADDTLPDCLMVTSRDEKSQLIMSMQHQTAPIFGVQFHPESIGTKDGNIIARNFLALC